MEPQDALNRIKELARQDPTQPSAVVAAADDPS